MQYSTLKMKDNGTIKIEMIPGLWVDLDKDYQPEYLEYDEIIQSNPAMTKSMHRTPFEQAAYDIQFRPKNRVSGTELGSTLTPNINQTKSDCDILVAIICLVAFISLLIVV